MRLNMKQNEQGEKERVVRKDFLIIPAYIILKVFLPIILVFGVLGIWAMVSQYPPPQMMYSLMLIISFLLAEGMTLALFYSFHPDQFLDTLKAQFHKLRSHLVLLGIVTSLVIIVIIGIQVLMYSSTFPLSYTKTQQEIRLSGMFKHPQLLILTWISFVVLRPLVEELIFRHLLIKEMGKVVPIFVVVLLSLISEVFFQVYDMVSILEIIPYMIMSLGSIYIYIRTRQNLMASYIYHSFMHALIFCSLIFKMYLI